MDWRFGDFTIIDLIAATTNAFNAALLARRPDHYKHFTVVGILLLGVIGGLAGGIARDLLLLQTPVALLNPAYLILALIAAGTALAIDYRSGQALRSGLFQFATSLALPWYAIIGAAEALDAGLPYLAAVLIGVVSATAGRYLVDLTCRVTPKLFIRSEWYVGTTILAAVAYLVCAAGFRLGVWPATLIAFVAAFVFRYAAMLRGWEEPEPWEPPELRATESERPPKEFGSGPD
ncbi:trimeric intracellular cation channel family protein [Catellatospora chokoriensis]|uniref:Glycine transporter domain-containing protein n=1 Tax=Catellatospora chokoriensis TaxID=310353 RepID=A0A8J3JVI0_9ACTN|nr:TRIC cation channel family protein [Catellatospora chokoriensis]GIF91806.1 hypothetical protein Cch02nite_52500 [Catellatospora chokoriensis]